MLDRVERGQKRDIERMLHDRRQPEPSAEQRQPSWAGDDASRAGSSCCESPAGFSVLPGSVPSVVVDEDFDVELEPSRPVFRGEQEALEKRNSSAIKIVFFTPESSRAFR